MATLTLVYFESGYSTTVHNVVGTGTFTCAGGETIIIPYSGLNTASLSAPTDSSGDTYTGFSRVRDSSVQDECGFFIKANAIAGSHTVSVSPPSGGEYNIWVIVATGMPATLNVRTSGTAQTGFGVTSVSATTSGNVQPGDLVFCIMTMENINTGHFVVLTDPPTGFTSWGSSNSIDAANGFTANNNLPSVTSYINGYTGAAGTVTAAWTIYDTTTAAYPGGTLTPSDISGATASIIALVPNPASPAVPLLGGICT